MVTIQYWISVLLLLQIHQNVSYQLRRISNQLHSYKQNRVIRPLCGIKSYSISYNSALLSSISLHDTNDNSDDESVVGINNNSNKLLDNATTSSIVSATNSNSRWNIPNILTVGRILMIPIFLFSFIINQKTLGIGMFLLASLTDLLDGYLARKLNQTSSFGAFLDPVADKLMVASACSLLICNLPVWWFAIPVALILCREISISALREYMTSHGYGIVKVGNLGKWKTALQMISISLLLISSSPDSSSLESTSGATSIGLLQSMLLTFGLLGFYISTILTLISGWQYFQNAFIKISEIDKKNVEDAISI